MKEPLNFIYAHESKAQQVKNSNSISSISCSCKWLFIKSQLSFEVQGGKEGGGREKKEKNKEDK